MKTNRLMRWLFTACITFYCSSIFSQPPSVPLIDYGDCNGSQIAVSCNGMLASNGRYYTPKGRLHVLVVLLYDPNTGQPNHPSHSLWQSNGIFPQDYNPQPFGPGIQNIIFNELPSTVSANQPIHNLSEYFYEFSDPTDPFIVTGIVYPEIISSTLPKDGDLNSATSINAHEAALAYIASKETASWWDQFDLRTQNDYVDWFLGDNSSLGPDGKIDYIVFMQGCNSGHGLASSQVSGYQIPGTTKEAGLGHSFQATPLGFDHFGVGFLHEYSHVNMAGPHYSGANNTHGNSYNVQNFYGMMGGGGCGSYSPTVWESWYNGWLTPTNFTEVHPPANNQGVTTFDLKDFANDHAGARIEIPSYGSTANSPQYLWLENRKLDNYWDKKQLYNVPNIMDTVSRGVYAFVTKGSANDLYCPNQVEPNFLKPISADGAWDWEYTGSQIFGASWGTRLFVSNKLEPNPISGGTYRSTYSADLEGALEGSPPNGILNRTRYTGNSNVKPYDVYNQAAEVVNGLATEHWKYAGNADEAFQPGGEISLSGNMPALNFPDYYDMGGTNPGGPLETLEPVYINGLSIQYLANNASGDATIEVRYNDYEVRNNKRWCGNIILPDFEPNNNWEYLNIATGVELRIDQSLMPHRETIHPVTGTWVNPTKFTIQDGGAMHLETLSNVIVENNSELILENGSRLEVHDGATVRVRSNGKLLLEGGSQIYVHDGGTVIIESGATIEYQDGADLVLNGFNSILEISGNLIIGQGADFTFRNGTSPNSGFVRFALPTTGSGAPNITCGTGASMTFTGVGTTDPVLEIMGYTTVHPDGNLNQLTIENGLITMGLNATLNTGNAAFFLNKLNVTAFHPANRHGGIISNGQADHLIEYVEISNGTRGITANQFYNDGASLKVLNSNLHDCDQALVVYRKGAILTNSNFDDNNYGYVHYYPSFNSRAASCNFDDNVMRGVHVFSSGGNLLFSKSNADRNGRDGIYYKGNGSLSLACASATENTQTGINAGHATYLILDNSVNPKGAQSIITKNPISILTNWTKDIYLNQGRNELVSLDPSTQSDVKGRMMKTCLPNSSIGLPSARNHWNKRRSGCENASSDPNLDYNVLGFSSCNVEFQDMVPACAPFTCEEEGGGVDPENPTPLESCPTCGNISTVRFNNIPLNLAVQSAIDTMEFSNSSGDDIEAIAMFYEIITFAYSSLNQEEIWLLNLAYEKMWITYANGCELGTINTNGAMNTAMLNQSSQQVVDAITSMKGLSTESLWIQSHEIDVAIAYSYVNSNGIAIDLLDSVIINIDSNLVEYATLLRCELAAENLVKTGVLPVWEFESAIQACNPALKIGVLSRPKDDVDEKTLHVTSFPNPSSSKVQFLITNIDGGKVMISLFDGFGKELLSKWSRLPHEETRTTIDLDASSFPSGIYTYRVTDLSGSNISGRIVIQH